MAVAVPIDREGPRADVLGHLLVVLDGDDERLAVGALQDFRLPERAVRLAVQDLEQPRHRLFHAGVRAGEDVAMAVAVEVHKLWSGAGASPHAGHFGHLAFGLQPLARRELAVAQVLEDPDLSLVNCPTSRSFLPSPSMSAQQGAA